MQLKKLLKYKSLIIMIATFLVCTLLNIIIAIVTGNSSVDMEVRKVSSIPLVIFSFVFIIAYFFLCFFLRIKKYKSILSGLVLYQFLGMFSFVVDLLMLMAGEESWLSESATHIFYWWSLPYHEAAVWFMNLLHFHLRIVLMLFVGMMSYVTVKSLVGIKVDISFEKKVQERKDSEAQAELESKKHRITTASEVEEFNRKFQ